jgi:uncharacterized membrane protein YfcA
MDLPLSFYIVAGIAIIVTGISKSGFAGGLGVMNVPLLSLFITPQLALAILVPILLAMDLFVVWHYRRTWNKAIVLAIIPGAIFGIILGTMTFQFMDGDFIKFAIGILSLTFVMQFFFTRKKSEDAKPLGRILPFILGSASGFAGFIAHAAGPPVKGLLLQQRLEKSEFVGTNGYFVFGVNIMKLFAYVGLGQMSLESMKVSLTLSPIILVGIGLGTYLHKIIDPKLFIKVVYVLLTVVGLKLLWDSVPNLSFAL